MDKDYINNLIFRLRKSKVDNDLREEVVDVINTLRFFLEEVHISAKQNKDRSAEHISGVALGKPGYRVGDASI